MKLDYRTFVWVIGGYFLVLLLGAGTMARLNLSLWASMIPVFIGAIIGFLLDQYYKKKESSVTKPFTK
jgi:uncharacterized membrane protein